MLLFFGLSLLLETCFTVCPADHPAHPLLVAWPSLWLACRCDLIHPPRTSYSAIFLKFKNMTGWKKRVSKPIFIHSWKLVIIKLGDLHELFQVGLRCRLVTGVEDPWGTGKALEVQGIWGPTPCTQSTKGCTRLAPTSPCSSRCSWKLEKHFSNGMANQNSALCINFIQVINSFLCKVSW